MPSTRKHYLKFIRRSDDTWNAEKHYPGNSIVERLFQIVKADGNIDVVLPFWKFRSYSLSAEDLLDTVEFIRQLERRATDKSFQEWLSDAARFLEKSK